MKLDVGCGHIPNGDVNVDLFTDVTVHRTTKKTVDKPLNRKGIPNFVKASSMHLPFRDNSFDKTYSAHVIEHVTHPFLMMKEMVRVTKTDGYVELKAPHRYLDNKFRATPHKHFFGVRWFLKALEKCNLTPITIDTDYTCHPHQVLCIIRKPWQIHIVARKLKVS